MKKSLLSAFLLAGVLCFVAMPITKADDDTNKAGETDGKGKGHRNPIDFILKHSSDLKLTDDQVTKLKALQTQTPGKELKDAIMAILTPDQQTQLETLRKDHKGHKQDKATN